MIVAGVVFGMIIKLIKSIHGIIGFIIDPLFLGSKYPPAQSAIDLFKIIQCQSLIKKLSLGHWFEGVVEVFPSDANTISGSSG